ASLDHGGGTIVGQDTLARELGVERETLNRALRAAVALGHLESIRRGRDKPNAYRMVLKDEADDVGKSQTSDAPYDVTAPVTSSPSRCDDSVPHDVTESVTQTPLFLPGALIEPPGSRERQDALTRINSLSGGAPPLTR